MNPSDNLSRGTRGPSRPPGVLPKNINFYVLGAIALLVLSASLFSGKKAPKSEETRPPIGPSEIQLKSFRKMLEKQAREASEAQRQLEAIRQREEKQIPLVQPSAVTREIDPFAERRRKRAADAPFATNFAFVAPKSEGPPISLTSQVAVLVERTEDGPVERLAPSERGPKESGTLLGAKDGNFFRLYQGTTIVTKLANRLDGSFTGPVLSVVAKNVLSSDGSSVVLIPIGSRFLGTASRVTVQNQVRLAVAFDRLLLPNGYSIKLDDAPGLDRAGEAGLKDQVDNHRLRRFGISGAIGILSGIAQFATRGNLFASAPINTTGSAVMRDLNDYLNALPTITIREGHAVIVYLPTDLLVPQYIPSKKETP